MYVYVHEHLRELEYQARRYAVWCVSSCVFVVCISMYSYVFMVFGYISICRSEWCVYMCIYIYMNIYLSLSTKHGAMLFGVHIHIFFVCIRMYFYVFMVYAYVYFVGTDSVYMHVFIRT